MLARAIPAWFLVGLALAGDVATAQVVSLAPPSNSSQALVAPTPPPDLVVAPLEVNDAAPNLAPAEGLILNPPANSGSPALLPAQSIPSSEPRLQTHAMRASYNVDEIPPIAPPKPAQSPKRQPGVFFKPWDRQASYNDSAPAAGQTPNTPAPNSQIPLGPGEVLNLPGSIQLQDCMPQTCGPQNGGPQIGNDFINNSCRCAGIVGGAEVLLLKPFLGARAPTGPVSGDVATYRYDAAQRYWLGYVREDGLGIRTRYFVYQHASNLAVANDPANANLVEAIMGGTRVKAFDVEATQQVAFYRWSLLTSAGLRYAQLGETTFANTIQTGINTSTTNDNRFHGLGLTAGLQGQRSLGPWESLSVYFAARGSILFGNQSQSGSTVNNLNNNFIPATAFVHNDTMAIWEIACGPQWQHKTKRGLNLFVRGGLEAQLWQPGNTSNIDLGNSGFAGFTTAFGLTR
jgi:hypothetical protein